MTARPSPAAAEKAIELFEIWPDECSCQTVFCEHGRAFLALALDAERTSAWEEAARALHLQADDMGKGHENARLELLWQADRFRARAEALRRGTGGTG